jgi:hypothetical protein
VAIGSFRPRARIDALRETAEKLDADDARRRGRPGGLDAGVAKALEDRDADALDALASRYDQEAPDPDAPDRLRALAGIDAPIAGYLGKLIPQKGVELLLAAHHAMRSDTHALVVGFGSHREWLQALAAALARDDREALAWLGREMSVGPVHATTRERGVTFTGRLDHRYAPGALAAMDVQVVPSVLAEAFGMVAAEGAAAGALPMLARHSGLAEVASALEREVGRPGLFSFEPGPGAVAAIAAGVDRLLSLPAEERAALREAVSAFVAREWTWERTAARLLDAAGVGERALARPVAYDERLAERVRSALDGMADVAEIKMFGGLCYTVRGHMAVGVNGSDLMVRLPPEEHDGAVAEPHARPMDLTGRPMRGFLFVSSEGIRNAKTLARWVDRGVAYASSLPPKKPKKPERPRG